MKNKWLLPILAGVVIAGGYYLFTTLTAAAPSQAAATTNLETVMLQNDSLVITIEATGKVRPKQSATLSWSASGVVGGVEVEPGGQVEEGQVLARLESTSLPQSVILAKADLIDARSDLDSLYADAETKRANALQALAEANSAVEDAKYNLDNFTAPSNQEDMTAVEGAEAMREKLYEAQEAFEPYKYKSQNNDIRESLLEELNRARADYKAAVNRLEYESALASAEGDLAQAQQDYQDALDAPDENDIAAVQARIDAAQATIRQAWVEAPFAGEITVVDTQPGDVVTAGEQAFRLDDLSALYMDLQISEIDINLIEPNQPVTLVFDAIPGQEFTGEVARMDPVGEENNGVVEFSVTISLDDAPAVIRPGMTAEVSIQVERREPALLVPNQSIRTENSQMIVYKVQAGEVIPTEIKLGVSSTDYSEVISGEVKAGDRIVLNPQTNDFGLNFDEGQGQGERGGMFGGGSGGGPFGGNGGQ